VDAKVGNVCRCKQGRLGVVTELKWEPGPVVYGKSTSRTLYKGIGFDGRKWQSVDPEVINDTLNDYCADI